jgi:hypothetical protein
MGKMAKFYEEFKTVKILKTIACVESAIWKSKRKLFNVATCEVQIPRKLLGGDLCGPLKSRSLGWSLYALMIVDYLTGYLSFGARKEK